MQSLWEAIKAQLIKAEAIRYFVIIKVRKKYRNLHFYTEFVENLWTESPLKCDTSQSQPLAGHSVSTSGLWPPTFWLAKPNLSVLFGFSASHVWMKLSQIRLCILQVILQFSSWRRRYCWPLIICGSGSSKKEGLYVWADSEGEVCVPLANCSPGAVGVLATLVYMPLRGAGHLMHL